MNYPTKEVNKIENDSHEVQIEATLSKNILILALPSQTLKKKEVFRRDLFLCIPEILLMVTRDK